MGRKLLYSDKIKKTRNKKKQLIIGMTVAILCILIVTAIYANFSNNNKVKATSPSNTLIKSTHNNDNKKIVSNSVQAKTSYDQTNYTYDAKEVHEALVNQKTNIDANKIVFLTFDDGPSTTITPKILDVLKQNNVHATFFLIGKEIELNDKSKEIVKEEYEQGNSIGNHTYSHNYNYLYPGKVVNVNRFMNDIDKTNNILKSILGQSFNTRIIRIPGGHMSWKGTSPLDKAFNEKGYVYIDWNNEIEDSEGPKKNKDQLFQVFKKYDTDQSRLVILMHDTYGKEATLEVLPEIISYLKDQGYQFRTLK